MRLSGCLGWGQGRGREGGRDGGGKMMERWDGGRVGRRKTKREGKNIMEKGKEGGNKKEIKEDVK